MQRKDELACVLMALVVAGIAWGEDTEARPMKAVVADVKAAMADQGVATLDATVEAIDVTNRMLTVRGPKGNTVTMKMGDHVQKAKDIKVGDSLRVQYREATINAIEPSTQAEAPGSMNMLTPRTGQPALTQKAWTTRTVTVDKVDTAARTLTFRTEEGKVETLKVAPQVKGLGEFKTGDFVKIRCEDAITFSIVPGTPAE